MLDRAEGTSTAQKLFAQKNCSTRFCFYSTAFEQTIFILSIGQQPYLTCFEVGSTGFKQLLLSVSTAQIVDHIPFEQLIYNKKNIIFARIEINQQIFSFKNMYGRN